MSTTQLLEGIERRAFESRMREEKPWLFDDADPECPACILEQTESEALSTIVHNGVPKSKAKEVLAAFYKYMTDRLGFGEYARKKLSGLAKKVVDWDMIWERLYELYESRPEVRELL